MDKKKIISNTILFVAIIAFINIFNMMFGEMNSVVGVTVITAALTLLQRDLTAAPVENLMNLIAINLFTGIFAYIASTNMWVGIPVNLIALFVLGYCFSSNLKTPVVIPFGLQYLFMLFTPVHGKEFSLRLAGLLFGAFFMMGLQLLANKNKIKKNFKAMLLGILSDFIEKLENGTECYESVTDKINKIKKIVYESRKKSFYICDEGKRVTNTISLLERINIIFEDRKLDEDVEFKNHMIESLKDLKVCIEKDKIDDMKFKVVEKQLPVEFAEVERCLNHLVEEVNGLSKTEPKADLHLYNIPEKFKTIKVMKDNFSIRSLRVSYALRLAIVGVISIFIVDYFKIPQGKWIVYTIFSLTQPYAESSKIRTRQRVEGTLIGAFLVVVAFTLVQDSALRGLVILLAGYLNPFAKDYKRLIVLVTVSAIASTALAGGTLELSLMRVVFVIFGGILAMLGSKFIIPYHLKDGNNEIKSGYIKIIETMKEDINESKDDNIVKSLYLLPAFFEDKFKATNIEEKELKSLAEFADNERRKLNEVYSRYYFMNKDEKEDKTNDFELVLS
ncbi:MAG: FUSC family protein [Sarcina sp.]